MDDSLLPRLADLLVRFGSNVQPGQYVAVGSELGKEALTREIVASAYRAGAGFVDVSYADPHAKRARVLNADPSTLEVVPPWVGAKMLALGEERAARIVLTGVSEPHLLDDLDPVLVGRERSSAMRESGQVMNARTTNWTIGACPTPGWAELVFPDMDPAAALERLWHEIAHVCRLDEDDPVAAWEARIEQLAAAAEGLAAAQLDALHFTGPGTDLTVGLLPTSRFQFARFSTIDGITHHPNVPSEEVFTSPDPERTEGVVRSTKPLLLGGTLVEDLEVEFRGGRAVRVDASKGADVVRAKIATDDGAARLGEVALVDGSGRIAPLGTVFRDTLLDENAASHIAFGRGFDFAVGDDDVARVNHSDIHVDFMIGGPGVQVHGTRRGGGDRVPVLVDGAWQV